ncbi:hypothetical protein FRC09_006084 [Ceratobasidium sp. 395]|nr:hypothetical protein FRC09_006084 [Ceratobasidium sp. 395]
MVQMLQNGEVSTSPALMELFPLTIDGPLLPWPDSVRDYKDMIVIERTDGMLTSSIRTTVWMGTLTTTRRRATTETTVAIKVPRLNAAPQHREPHDHLQHMIRKMLRTRFGVRHRNIVDIIGIHTGFEPHPGFVLEYCAGGSLTVFCKENYAMDLDGTVRLPSPDTNAYSLICDILEGLGYMHNYPVPIPQGDLTPVRPDLILHYLTQATGQDNILVSVDGIAKIGLFSVGRIIAAVPAAASLTSSIFTGLRPYAGRLRDDFAGVDSVRGLPPGDISRIDYSKQLGERVLVPRESSWITNGIWDLTSKCWALNPLLRPSAGGFLRALKGLDGKSQNWIPPNVKDLAKKIQRVDLKENWVPMALYDTTWRQYNTRQGVKVYEVRMILVRNTYTPNWYSKPAQVTVKQVFLGWTSSQWLDPRSNNPSVRHEIAIMAQLDHPNICKLIGIDTSFGQVPSMVFESFGDRTLDRYLDEQHKLRQEMNFSEMIRIFKELVSALAYIHEHPNGTIVHGSVYPQHIFITDSGHVRLTNFTSAFQYIVNRSQIPAPLSSVVSTPYRFSHWQSPEYYRNFQDENADHIPLPTIFSDIWSFGCVLLSTFARDLPFFSMGVSEAVEKIREGASPCPPEQYSLLDPRIVSLVRSILVQDPAARPSAREILQSLSKFA